MLYPDESYRIMGCCYKVHNTMGCGFLEAVYHECLEIEFTRQGIPFASQPILNLHYDGELLKKTYEPDFVCFGCIVLEIKATEQLIPRNEAQLLNCLNATGYQLGILVNFGTHPKLEDKRLALTHSRYTPN